MLATFKLNQKETAIRNDRKSNSERILAKSKNKK